MTAIKTRLNENHGSAQPITPAPHLPRSNADDAFRYITETLLVIGTTVQAWDADLDAIAALSGTGFAVRTASNTWAQRTITGTANEVTLTNGDGVSGNPVVSLPNALTFTGKTITGGSFTGGTWNNGIIGGSTPAAGTFTAVIGNSFVPNLSTVPTNGMYLPAGNTLGWAINSAAEMQLTATALSPAVDGGNSLGTTALGWQNLFGNTGFVINIENSDWVATHTTGILTVGTGDLRVTNAGSNTASAVTVGGSQTLTSKTLTKPVFTGQASPTYAAGALTYDTDNECLTFYNNDSNVSLQIGQEQWIRVSNNSGSTIANGAAVYISGASGGLPTIALARANVGATSDCVGLATESIANGATGFVTAGGRVNGIDTSGFAAGATLYLSSATAGLLTTTIPSAPNFRVKVGSVGTSNASTGTIHVALGASRLGLGTANQVAGMDSAGTGSEYKTVQGTANEITVTHAANLITWSLPSVIVLTGKTVTNLITTAGTTAIPSMTHTAGVVLTTPAAGAREYDGSVFYNTPVASNRAVDISSHILTLSANQTGTNVNTAQPWFPGGGATGITVPASTTYYFEGTLAFSKTAGTTSRTIGLNFGGTATITSIIWESVAISADATSISAAAPQMVLAEVATNVTAWATASISANQYSLFKVRGMVRINGAGTFIPNFQYSAAPGGAPTIRANTSFRMTPVGSGSVLSVGNWS